MDDQVAVGVIHGLAHLEEEEQPRLPVELMLVAVAVDGLALDVLGDKERVAGRREAAIEEPRDVVVVQRRQKLAFGLEAAEKFAIGKVARQDRKSVVKGKSADLG